MMFREFHNIVNFFFFCKPAMQRLLVSILNTNSILKYQCEGIYLIEILGCKTGNLPTRFLWNWASLTNKQNPWIRRKVFYSCSKHTPSTGNPTQTPSPSFLHQLSHQTNINQSDLLGAIFAFMFHLSYIIRGHIETMDKYC